MPGVAWPPATCPHCDNTDTNRWRACCVASPTMPTGYWICRVCGRCSTLSYPTPWTPSQPEPLDTTPDYPGGINPVDFWQPGLSTAGNSLTVQQLQQAYNSIYLASGTVYYQNPDGTTTAVENGKFYATINGTMCVFDTYEEKLAALREAKRPPRRADGKLDLDWAIL